MEMHTVWWIVTVTVVTCLAGKPCESKVTKTRMDSQESCMAMAKAWDQGNGWFAGDISQHAGCGPVLAPAK